jgi:hypothetical protein
MDVTLLKTAGQIAGIGGIALVVPLLLYRDIIRKRIFPKLTKDQGYRLIRLIAVLIFMIALAGLGGWVWVEIRPVPPPAVTPSPSVTAEGGVAAGSDINAGKIDIQHTDTPNPPSDNHPEGGVTARGGVASGGNVKAEEIKINAR